MVTENSKSHILDINDPNWGQREKLAYLHDLRNSGIPSMPQNRGKLLDVHGNDRSDLIPEAPADGDLSPMIMENMTAVMARIDTLIAETSDQLAQEIMLT